MNKYVLLCLLSISAISLHAMNPKAENASAPALTALEQTFFKATYDENVQLFSECLAKGVDCNVGDGNAIGGYGQGETALQTICLLGHYLLLPLLLNVPGIDVNKIDKFGDTALHYAANHNASQTPGLHALLIASLIKNGANVNAQNNALETPLSALMKIPGQPSQLCELLIVHGADISLTLPHPNPLDPIVPIVYETIFERVIRYNNPLHLYAFLKSPKGITKPTILKALILAKFGFKNVNWGKSVWPKAFAEEHLKSNFKMMGQILKRYYIAMQGLGFYANAKDKESDWHCNPNSVQIPLELAKKIAWHAAKDAPLSLFEKECLIILFGKKV